MIGELYSIEADIRGKAPDERLRFRQEKSKPLLAKLEATIRVKLATLSTKSALAKAINYSLNHWAALVFYCEDGRVEISNVLAENALRCVALGRNNAQPQIMRSLHRTARHARQCDAPCRDLWRAANCT
jgi:transposase